MKLATVFVLNVILFAPLSVAQQSAQVEPGIRMAPGPLNLESMFDLNDEINKASPSKIYSVGMFFDEPVRLEELRKISSQLGILRLLASVSYGPDHGAHGRATARVGVGTVYEGETAWRHETCKARIYASFYPTDPLHRIPPEQWMVNEVHVYGPAGAIRELQSGTSLPIATITDGGAEGSPGTSGFISHEKRELAKKIQIEDGATVPEDCREFAKRIEAPVLTGRQPIQYPVYGNTFDPDFRELIRPFLSARGPATPVTIYIVLNFDATVEDFAKLVSDYDIDGLSTELSPADTSIRSIMIAELSVHGMPVIDQVQTIRCQMQLGAGAAYSGEWYGRRAQLSVPVSKAWQLIDDENLVDAKLENDFAPGALEAVKAYHVRKSSGALPVHASTAIPAECEKHLSYQE